MKKIKKEKESKKCISNVKLLFIIFIITAIISIISISTVLIIKSKETIKDDNIEVNFKKGNKFVSLNKKSYTKSGINTNSVYEFDIKNKEDKEKAYTIALTDIKVNDNLIKKKAIQYTINYDNSTSVPIYSLNSKDDLIISTGKLKKDQTIKVKVTIFINGENGIKGSDIKDNAFNAKFDMKTDNSYLKNEYAGQWKANKLINTEDGSILLNDAIKNYLLQWNNNITKESIESNINIIKLENDGTFSMISTFSTLYSGTYKVKDNKIELTSNQNDIKNNGSLDIIKKDNVIFLRLKIEYLKGKYGYLYFERINEDNEIPNEKVETKEENTNTATENKSDTSTNIKVGNKTLEYGTYIDYVNNEKAILNKDKTFSYEDTNGDKYTGTYYTEYSSDGYFGMQYYIVLNTTIGKKVYFEVINNNHMSDQWHELILTEN